MDKRLVQRILVSYGEVDLASNEELINEMLEAAQTVDGTLNTKAFSNGLTNDVQLYDIRNEARRSTNYDDVFLTKNHRISWVHRDEEDGSVSRDVFEERMSLSKVLNRKFTAPAIDMVVGTFRSKTIMVMLWVMYVNVYCIPNGIAVSCTHMPMSQLRCHVFWLRGIPDCGRSRNVPLRLSRVSIWKTVDSTVNSNGM